MALEEQTWIERVLIVFNPDGTLKGAQQTRMTAIFRDGERLAADQEHAAEPLMADALVSSLPTVAALTAQCGQQVTQIEVQRQEIERLWSAVEDGDRTVEAQRQEIARLTSELEKMRVGGE